MINRDDKVFLILTNMFQALFDSSKTETRSMRLCKMKKKKKTFMRTVGVYVSK